MASSNDQQIQPHLMAKPTTLNHIPIAVNKEQEEQDQTFGNYINYIPNHFNGFQFSPSVFLSRIRFRFGSWSQTQYFAPGYRFCPLDSELIVHYLRKKVNNEALPHNGIRDVTLYQHNPEYLTARYPALGDKKWYFFTSRDRKYPNGFRPNRATDNGYWKATGADKFVHYKDQVVGPRKALVFYEGKPKPGKGIKTNWIMHEFRVKGPPRIKENQHDMKQCIGKTIGSTYG
ncbi:NAC transcription factor 47-like [Rhododendron vialii]|uniref:NAC transcription factor 47-like n=1 Tax=Rhododendron vialii TaxID=182163 RepID=UPI00265F0CB5|nr:NAC transcription factor 47-like [Rhododendron vialii]